MHSFADKSVRGYFAILSYESILLYLYKGTDLCIVIYAATVKINEVKDLNVFSKFYIVDILSIKRD